MSEDQKKDDMQKDVNAALGHLKRGPGLPTTVNTEEWEKMIDASDRTSQEKQKLKELGRFLSLKQYLEEQGQVLEPILIEGFLELHRFPVTMQITWLGNANRKLMGLISDAGPRA